MAVAMLVGVSLACTAYRNDLPLASTATFCPAAAAPPKVTVWPDCVP
jgi:hypothetical protein